MNKILKAIKNPKRLFLYILSKPISNFLPDKIYLKWVYSLTFNRKLNLKNPTTFNEKLQWLKLYNRKAEYTTYVDKYKVRDYIAKTLGEEYLIPLLGVWEDPEDIDFDALPEKFVLKCNHNSGFGMCICTDKSKLNVQKVKKELKKGLKQNYYLSSREWPYKNVERKIICEQYMVDSSGTELKDYKLWCFNGRVKLILTCAERFSKTGLKENFYSPEWELLDLKRPTHGNTDYEIEKPVNLEKMIGFAEKLSNNIPFLRVDFYEVDGQLYFGELTFFPASGTEKFEPEKYDLILGDWIDLHSKNA